MSPDTSVAAPVSGLISHIQRFSIHDGPGIRTTVFFMGCSLSCAWCHNPETRSRQSVIITTGTRCIHCGACISVCPVREDDSDRVFQASCRRCGDCVSACPTGARSMMGIHKTSEELMEILERDALFFSQSGGGVTFSGGEPMERIDFLHDCLRLCKEHGFHTTVDTSGYCPMAAFEKIMPYVDLFLYDLKLVEDSEHRKWTGVPVLSIRDNLRYLAANTISVRIRIPLIPDVTMSDSNIEGIGELLSSLPDDLPVELLPYHCLGNDKADRMGLSPQRRFRSPASSEIDDTVEILHRFGLTVLGHPKS